MIPEPVPEHFSALPRAISDPHKADRVKILTVEDDAVARALLRQALRRLGHEAVEAPDGNAAWEMLQKNDTVRVVVSDWVMPNSDGLELCRKIRGRVGAE